MPASSTKASPQAGFLHEVTTRNPMSTAIEAYKPGIFDLTHKLTVEKHGHTALITINHPPANT